MFVPNLIQETTYEKRSRQLASRKEDWRVSSKVMKISLNDTGPECQDEQLANPD